VRALTGAWDPSPDGGACRLLVCVGPRCDAEGRGRVLLTELRNAISNAFPEASRAGRISCVTRDCLRSCTRDPIVRLEPSGEVFSNPAVEELLGLCASILDP
jgi:NADH:ubiquinone oxidoreductase subunit E